jgi:predicted hydrocarbon binding protein
MMELGARQRAARRASTVHGYVLTTLRRFVIEGYGYAAWYSLLEAAGIGPREYANLLHYPDEEVAALVKAASELTGAPVSEVVERFGQFIGRDLLSIYRPLVDPAWRTLDLLEHTEETIHRAVRTLNAHAHPPALRAERTAPNRVVVFYRSARQLCALARGIVYGVASVYRERVAIAEPSCMLAGADHCRLEVSLLEPTGE